MELGLGYSFDPGHWGTGYAVEACRALTGHIFRVIQPHRIVALAMADNHPSRRVMEKLGIAATARASFYLYNDFEDVDRLLASLEKAIDFLR